MMNERIKQLAEEAEKLKRDEVSYRERLHNRYCTGDMEEEIFREKFAELIVKEMCGLMEQAEDDAYHCFEPSERPTEYIEWLRDWQERVAKHFGVEQ